MRMCNCGSKVVRIKQAALARANEQERWLVLCTDCNMSLQNAEGSYVPVHAVPVSVSSETVRLWQSQGHVLESTRL